MATYDYASKGLANGVGIPALVLGSLGFLQSSANNGGGLLGGLFGGGNCNQVTALMAENSMLKAEKYSDKNTAEVYAAMRNEIQALQDRVFDKYIEPISKEIADMRVREVRLEGKIGEVGLLANNGITALQGQVNCLAQTVAGITKTVVPIGAVCPQPMPQYNSWTAPTAPTTGA